MSKKIIIASLLSLAVLSLAVMPVFAQLGIEYGASTGLGKTDIRTTIGTIIKTLLGLIGIILVVIVLYAGFLWMTAMGNDEQVTKAKGMIINAVIGLAVVLAAYAITSFVVQQLTTATGFTP